MRWRPWLWLCVSVLCFVGAAYFWRLGDKWAAEKAAAAQQQDSKKAEETPVPPKKPETHSMLDPMPLLSSPGNLNALPASTANSSPQTNASPLLPYRLSNNPGRSFEALARSDASILLENALIDTSSKAALAIPDSLRAQGDPGAYIVQARGPITAAFRKALKSAGASIVAYIPNNAYLVRASQAVAQELGASPLTQTVLAYEPYYKLRPALLKMAVEQATVPSGTELNVLLFAGAEPEVLPELDRLGTRVVQTESSPFGPVLRVSTPGNVLADLASLPGVQEIEPAPRRSLANDLSRVAMGVAADSVTTTNYLGLTGSNVLVTVSDTGVDTNHPALTGRVGFDVPISGVDSNGHGTHVAGIIAGDGSKSDTVTNASGSIMPGTNGQFRGMAPGAKLYAMGLNQPDTYLQEMSASNNAWIANNSWTYNTAGYDLAAASYDAAVRDSLPRRTGPQPMVYVFPAGNRGAANVLQSGAAQGGTGGDPDTVESPGTAKNVITVGAVEQMRNITNEAMLDPSSTNTSMPWFGSTDSSNQVTSFSGRGNVGIHLEGDFGRFKPDVVAPGTFVVSARSGQWDQAAYYQSTSTSRYVLRNQQVDTNSAWISGTFIPANAVQFSVAVIRSDSPAPLPVSIIQPDGAVAASGNGTATVAPPNPAFTDDFWTYWVSNNTSRTVVFDVVTTLVVTNSNGDFFQVLSNMNQSLGGYYRYESGTSMSAADVSGTLALIAEFFQTRLHVTNSPALMKALLINGARSLGDAYNYQVQSSINYQGWGLVQVPNSIPAAMTNLYGNPYAPSPLYFFDQNPTNALATGQSQTRFFTLSPLAQDQPLRFTVAWTDPPGNPTASVKLVNDLDLVVTNLDTGEIYFGNNIDAGNDFNLPWDTNGVPPLDFVNNVENIYLRQPFGTNFSVTVTGHRVNVNAVSTDPDQVAQDYALVVSSGNGLVPDALTLKSGQMQDTFVTLPNVFYVTNSFPGDPENPISGGLLQHQHVGANTPLVGTNTLPLLNSANGVVTLGVTNQWHFYVLSNDFNYTNASFVTFLPPELGVPRMGVTNYQNPDDATRVQADIDMYVSMNPGLTNLDPLAIDGADKSLSRGGTEFIVYSNAPPGGVYYVGIKAEDQMAAEYAFLGVFSQFPPTSSDTNGNRFLRGMPVPSLVPPGTPNNPQAALVLGLDTMPVTVRRVIVTNTMTHNSPGSLLGILSHNSKFAVLNNHTCAEDVGGNCITNIHDYIYEDNGEGNVPFSRPSDGPGNLKEFIGEEGLGVWLLSMVNDFPAGTGVVNRLWIKLEPQSTDTNGVTHDVLPNTFVYDSIEVPADATNLTVCVSGNTQPMELYVQRGATPSTVNYDYHLTINPPGDCLQMNIFDTPPLVAGRYYIGVYNPAGNTIQHIRVLATVFRNPYAVASSLSSFTGPVPIADDAVTYAYITNLVHMTISSVDIGMLINHPRISDLAITLISPNGTRVLLFEDRGAWSTNGLGTFSSLTNSDGVPVYAYTNMVPFYTNDFDAVDAGYYAPGAVFDGWHVLSNYALIYPEMPAPWISNNVLVLGDGVVSNSLPTTNSTFYSLSFEVSHAPFLAGTVAWWPLDGNGSDIYGGFNGLLSGDVLFNSNTGMVNQAFFGDGVATRMMVPRCAGLDVGQRPGFTIEGWIRPQGLGQTVTVTNPEPILEWYDTNVPPQGVQFWLGGLPGTNAPGALFANLWASNGQPHIIATVTNAITNANWQHVALTYDARSRVARIYRNGALLTATPLAATNFIPVTSSDLFLGYHPEAAPNYAAFQGGLDEFGLYERALTDCEIQAIYSAGTLGKYGTNVLWCPVTNGVQLITSLGTQNYTFTNGLTWRTNGIRWETNTIYFNNTLGVAYTNGPVTNFTSILLTNYDQNAALDEFVLSSLQTNYINGMLHFSENTNLALVPIKFAPSPYLVSNFPPTLIFSNDFEMVTQGIYQAGAVLPGSTNNPAFGPRNWTVINGPVTVVSNALVDAVGSNSVALAGGGLQCALPTTPGNRYRLTYSVRGPGAVSWWSGDVEPLSRRAWDLLGGNHGAFIQNATNSNVGLVDALGDFNTLLLPGVINPTNGLASKIEVGDPANLILTNGFTIEGWIRPLTRTNIGTEQILFRGDSRDCLDPYYLALQRVNQTDLDIVFHIDDGVTRDCGISLETLRQPVHADRWQHIAAVFDSNVLLTNRIAWRTNQLRLYLNGQHLLPQNQDVGLFDSLSLGAKNDLTGRFPIGALDPAFSPGVSIGNRSRYDYSQPFGGYIDELTVYGRALSDPEVAAIARAGAAGKADFRATPAFALGKVNVLVNNIVVDTGNGDNARWTTRTVNFTADRTNLVLTLQSLLPGTIVDGITLTEMPAELNYLPEEPLSSINGEDAYGVWQLEIWDTRSGGYLTNGLPPELLQWQLNFVLQPSNPPPIIHLQHGIPYTNLLTAHGVQNFVVDVPQWATQTTNVLLFAGDRSMTNTEVVGVLYSPTNIFPNSITNGLFWPPVSAGVTNLTTNSVGGVYIVPGQPYYLTVTNPNPFAISFAYGVWFDITTLTNCQPATNFVWQAGIPRYFQFDVPTNAVPPVQALFYLTGSGTNTVGWRSNLTVVVSQHLPLPDLTDYDYISRRPSTNDDLIMVLTNTTPFPLESNRWYAGVFSRANTNIQFTVQACYVTTNSPVLIPLTNGVEYSANIISPFAAPPGPPKWFFFEFDITNYVDAVLFEMYNASGDGDLVLQRDIVPAMAPYLAGSFATGWSTEQIVLRAGEDLTDLRGKWYLGVYNHEATNLAYTVRAVTSQGGLLLPGLPVAWWLSPMPPPHGMLLQWNSVIGEYYEIDFSPDQVNNWQILTNGLIRATTPLTTFEVPIPPPGGGYRVVQVSRNSLPVGPLGIQLWTNNMVRIYWSTNFPVGTLQSAPSPSGPWLNVTLPVLVEGNEYVVYDTIGTAPRYYRLIP